MNRIAKNAGWLIFGRMAQMVINLVVGMLTARYLGPSNYGLINYAGAYVAFFSAFCTLGINSVLVKELIEQPNEEGVILGTSLVLRAISSFLSAIIIICFVCVIDSDSFTTVLVVGLSTVGMIFHIFEIFNYWFQSKLESKVTAIVTLIAHIITALYKAILLVMGRSVHWFAFSTSVDYILIAILLMSLYRQHDGAKLRFSWTYGKRILSQSCHFILPSLMVSIYGQTDKLMLKHLLGTSELGYYSTSVAICNTWCFVLTAIIDSMYPSIMEAHKQKKAEKFIKQNKLLYALVFYISMIVSLVFVIFAEPIVIILYGNAYLPAAAPLRVITCYTAFSYLGAARNAWIVCKGQQKYLLYVYISAAVVNVLLNIVLIPIGGTVGAAVASVIAQIFTTIIVPFFIKGLRENSKLMIDAICFK